MEFINFDKAIDYSRKIVNREIELPESFNAVKLCGALYSYSCGNSAQIPADHVGLSYLVYNQIINCLSTLKVNEDKTIIREFESLDNLQNINATAFMKNVDADVLKWYVDNNGNSVRLSEFGSPIYRNNPYNKAIGVDKEPKTQEDYREIALRGGFAAGLRDYIVNATSNLEEDLTLQEQEDIVNFVNTQVNNFENCLSMLKNEELVPIVNTTEQ